MRVIQVAWLPYRIPYAATFTTTHGSEQTRLGAVIRITADDGRVGLGEAAPLPAFGGGTLEDTLAQIAQLAVGVAGQNLDAALARLVQVGSQVVAVRSNRGVSVTPGALRRKAAAKNAAAAQQGGAR